jgi:acyl dehydratase
MTETQCLTASTLQVGQTYGLSVCFTRAQVDTYCELTGDRNGIHRDPEAARIRFPGIADVVVPGGLIQTTISGVLGTRFPGDGALGLSFAPERFRKPVCPGDRLEVGYEIVRIKGQIVEIDVTVDDETGTRIGFAKAKVLAPDDAYRAWWESQQAAPPA